MNKSKDKTAFLKHLETIFCIDNKRKRVRIEQEEYDATIEAFDIECIPNFYSIAFHDNEFNFKNITYTLILYRTFWGFLYVNENSHQDIRLLISSLEQNSKEATNSYLQEQINKSFSEFKDYLYIKYGFNADDFQKYEFNNLLNYSYHNENDYTSKYRYKTKDEIYSLGLHPCYSPQYSYPSLKQLQNNKVSFEFSILDDEKEIIRELKKILRQEKQYKRREISSFTDNIYSQLGVSNENKFQSKKILTQSLIIYKYLQYTKSIKQAVLIYNFHLLHSNTEKFHTYIYENATAMMFNRGKSNISCFDMASNDDFISTNTANKEIRLQINQIKLLLNL